MLSHSIVFNAGVRYILLSQININEVISIYMKYLFFVVVASNMNFCTFFDDLLKFIRFFLVSVFNYPTFVKWQEQFSNKFDENPICKCFAWSMSMSVHVIALKWTNNNRKQRSMRNTAYSNRTYIIIVDDEENEGAGLLFFFN